MAGAPLLEVLAPGLLTTVQDLGRFGYARWGVAASGAVDALAARTANLLVGNPPGDAVVETTLMGLRLRVLRDTYLAVCGGDLEPKLDGEAFPLWRGAAVRAGQVLSFAGPRWGLRAYVAVSGGIDVPEVLGSRSTNLTSGFGGFQGRSLRKGDLLAVGEANAAGGEREFDPAAAGYDGPPWRLRILWGPQEEMLAEEGRTRLLSSVFTVSPDSDRTGLRLQGPAVPARPGAPDSIISEGVVSGAIQLPADGQPIILLNETVSGGYRKPATVIAADLHRLGQIMPGEEVRFEVVTLEEAVSLLARLEERVRAAFRPLLPR